MDNLQKFAVLTSEKNEELINVLLDEAENFVLSYTNRKIIPKILEGSVLQIAIVKYNRLGTEGEQSRSQGNISLSYDELPDDIKAALNNCRLAKVNGHAFEKA